MWRFFFESQVDRMKALVRSNKELNRPGIEAEIDQFDTWQAMSGED